MKLISDYISEDVQYIEEKTETGEKKQYLSGPFIATEQANRNRRIYPAYIDEEVKRYIAEKVNHKTAYGELNHPQGATINLDKVSHLITDLHKEGKNWIGKALITETPCGSIVKGLLASGGRLGVSTRGMGSLKPTNEGVMEVQRDFRLITAGDVVSDPSGPGCWVNGIMEGVEWFWDEKSGAFLPEAADEAKKELRSLSKTQIEERQLRLFESFLNKISRGS